MIARAEFLLSIRDSGYKGLEWALAELLDNAIEAKASKIAVFLPDHSNSLGDDAIGVHDNGVGMSRSEALMAASFGGTSRFGSRTGMGRFGMGLPCSSLSQARRFEIVTLRRGYARCAAVCFDLDDALGGHEFPRTLSASAGVRSLVRPGGTLVTWKRLDRVEAASWKRKAESIRRFVSRKYRYHLLRGVQIEVAGMACPPDDPLLCLPGPDGSSLAEAWGPPLYLTLNQGQTPVSVRFSLLKISDLAHLPAEQKRQLGIAGKAGVSVLRAGREIDFGWFFIDRRRENYDDWWRAEIAFEPEYDELFGVSYTKQGIRPSRALRVALTPHLTDASRVLQRKVREAHAALILDSPVSGADACADANRRDEMLRPLPNHPLGSSATAAGRYSLNVAASPSHRFVDCRLEGRQVRVTVNKNHLFHEELYAPALHSQLWPEQARRNLQLMLLAFARASVSIDPARTSPEHEEFLDEFSHNIKHFLRRLR